MPGILRSPESKNVSKLRMGRRKFPTGLSETWNVPNDLREKEKRMGMLNLPWFVKMFTHGAHAPVSLYLFKAMGRQNQHQDGALIIKISIFSC